MSLKDTSANLFHLVRPFTGMVRKIRFVSNPEGSSVSWLAFYAFVPQCSPTCTFFKLLLGTHWLPSTFPQGMVQGI